MKEITKRTIDNYVEHGLLPGSFVTAVLSNDLMGALGKADIDNRRDIFEICQYVWDTVPVAAHGSPQKVSQWLKRKSDERKKSHGG